MAAGDLSWWGVEEPIEGGRWEVGTWEVEINRSLENDNNVNVLLLFSFSILGI